MIDYWRASLTSNNSDAPAGGPSVVASAAAEADGAEPERPDAAGILSLALTILDDGKAEDIVTINLDGKSAEADAMVVASGRSQRHVGAIADQVLKGLKDAGLGRCRVEGMPNCDWVLIDAGDVIIHLFRPEVREFYKLERIWSPEAMGEAANG